MRGGMMEGFTHDQITVKVRLLTSVCEACAEMLEVRYVPSELAPYVDDTPTFREAEKQREEWDQEHAKQCKRAPVLLSA
jgi:hypothetical protein